MMAAGDALTPAVCTRLVDHTWTPGPHGHYPRFPCLVPGAATETGLRPVATIGTDIMSRRCLVSYMIQMDYCDKRDMGDLMEFEGSYVE